MPISPFRQTGPTITIATSSSATLGVLCSSNEPGPQQYIVTNSDTTNDAFIAMGSTAVQAQQNCAIPTATTPALSYRVLHASQITLTGPQNTFFSAIAVAGNPRIDVTPGYGS